MHGDAFQRPLVRCNWGEIRLLAPQVNAFLDNFSSAADNFFFTSANLPMAGTYNSHLISQDMQHNFLEMCKKNKNKKKHNINLKLLMQLYITRVLLSW